MSFEQLKMKLEKKQVEEDGGDGAEKTVVKQRPRKKIFENIKFEEGVRALREEKEKFMLGEKENSCPNAVKKEVLGAMSCSPGDLSVIRQAYKFSLIFRAQSLDAEETRPWQLGPSNRNSRKSLRRRRQW